MTKMVDFEQIKELFLKRRGKFIKLSFAVNEVNKIMYNKYI